MTRKNSWFGKRNLLQIYGQTRGITTLALTLTHIWLFVDNMQRALSFYHETLDLEVLSNLGEYVELNVNEQFILSLFERTALEAGEPGIAIGSVSGQRATLAFEVEPLDEFCEGLRAKGVEFVSNETNHAEWGLRAAFLHDPDGNLLCLYGGIMPEEELIPNPVE
jgi:catechol 2,3-dioxygenase-like lactoylglutathione lyase family enzyme